MLAQGSRDLGTPAANGEPVTQACPWFARPARSGTMRDTSPRVTSATKVHPTPQ